MLGWNEVHLQVVVYQALKRYPARLDPKAITNLLGYDYLAFWSDNIAHGITSSIKYNSRKALRPKEARTKGIPPRL